jgi:hypothetical protein
LLSPHHDWHQVDGYLVEQPQIQALPGNRASSDRDDTVTGEILRSCDRSLHAVDNEGDGASGCASTQSVGTWWITTTTGTSRVWRPCQLSATSNRVRNDEAVDVAAA